MLRRIVPLGAMDRSPIRLSGYCRDLPIFSKTATISLTSQNLRAASILFAEPSLIKRGEKQEDNEHENKRRHPDLNA
jgi:hypothetical protein